MEDGSGGCIKSAIYSDSALVGAQHCAVPTGQVRPDKISSGRPAAETRRWAEIRTDLDAEALSVMIVAMMDGRRFNGCSSRNASILCAASASFRAC